MLKIKQDHTVAIENEIKFVLTRYDELELLLSSAYGWEDINQAYFNSNNRIRKSTFQNGREEHVFAFKQRLRNGRTVEIESEISESEFDDLWEFTDERLFKRRSSIFCTKKNKDDKQWENVHRWDVDFPRWPSGNKYFVVAEVEMVSDMERPNSILSILKPFVIHEVPRDDNRFSAKKLSDDKHAKKLAIELGLWK